MPDRLEDFILDAPLERNEETRVQRWWRYAAVGSLCSLGVLMLGTGWSGVWGLWSAGHLWGLLFWVACVGLLFPFAFLAGVRTPLEYIRRWRQAQLQKQRWRKPNLLLSRRTHYYGIMMVLLLPILVVATLETRGTGILTALYGLEVVNISIRCSYFRHLQNSEHQPTPSTESLNLLTQQNATP